LISPFRTQLKYFLACLLLILSPQISLASVRIAASSDMQFVLNEIAAIYQNTTGTGLDIEYGSSGNLARRIIRRDKFDLFLSASPVYVDLLVKRDLAVDKGLVLASNHLCLFLPADSRISATPDLSDLKAAIEDGRLGHLAVPDPTHTGHGLEIDDAIQRAGMRRSLRPHIRSLPSAAHALESVLSGNSQAAILPYSLVTSTDFDSHGQYVLLSQQLYKPVKQQLVLLREANNEALEFFNFLQQPLARSVMKKYGLIVPDSSASTRQE